MPSGRHALLVGATGIAGQQFVWRCGAPLVRDHRRRRLAAQRRQALREAVGSPPGSCPRMMPPAVARRCACSTPDSSTAKAARPRASPPVEAEVAGARAPPGGRTSRWCRPPTRCGWTVDVRCWFPRYQRRPRALARGPAGPGLAGLGGAHPQLHRHRPGGGPGAAGWNRFGVRAAILTSLQAVSGAGRSPGVAGPGQCWTTSSLHRQGRGKVEAETRKILGRWSRRRPGVGGASHAALRHLHPGRGAGRGHTESDAPVLPRPAGQRWRR